MSPDLSNLSLITTVNPIQALPYDYYLPLVLLLGGDIG